MWPTGGGASAQAFLHAIHSASFGKTDRSAALHIALVPVRPLGHTAGLHPQPATPAHQTCVCVCVSTRSLSLSLSLSLSVCLYLCLCLYVSVCADGLVPLKC